ncbi:MAG: hypothetical protein GY698_05880 [Actinomycetia bacterium]|nr:hypothetical protein [Actinomycetes bacterium]
MGEIETQPGESSGQAPSTLRLLDDWHHLDLDALLGFCRDLVEDTSFPTVNRWRANGGKVLGHFQVYFPEEIAHAAGMLPFKLRGAPLEARNAESFFGSYLCSIVKTSFELVLNGAVELDVMVSHPICDAARNLAGIWGRNFDHPCEVLYLPQNANSAHTVDYLAGEYRRMARTIEGVTGVPIDEADLARSIMVFNENRELLRRLYDLKREQPWLVSVDEAFVLMVVGSMITRDEHNELLAAALPMLEQREGTPRDRIRLVLEGGYCELPPLDLLRRISRNAYVVDDDLLIGMRWITSDVEAETDPFRALAHAYIEQSSYSPVQHDLRKPKEQMLLERVRAARADAVFLMQPKMCEPGLDEQVAYIKALDDEKVAYFISEFEEAMTSFDQVELQIETFAENLLFA